MCVVQDGRQIIRRNLKAAKYFQVPPTPSTGMYHWLEFAACRGDPSLREVTLELPPAEPKPVPQIRGE